MTAKAYARQSFSKAVICVAAGVLILNHGSLKLSSCSCLINALVAIGVLQSARSTLIAKVLMDPFTSTAVYVIYAKNA